MYEELYRDSLRLDRDLEELCGADIRLEELNSLLPGLASLLPDLEDSIFPSQTDQIPRLKALLFAINEDRKRLRTENFSLICSQAISQPSETAVSLSNEVTSLIKALEKEREEKNQLLVLLRIIGKELQRSKPAEQMFTRKDARAATVKVTSEPVTPRLKRKSVREHPE